MKTAKQIALDIGHTERCVLLAIRKIGIVPTEIKPHAGKFAKYYDEAAQEKIIAQVSLPRTTKIRQNGPIIRQTSSRQPRAREKWTYRYIGRALGTGPRGARSLLELKGFPVLADFIHSNFSLEDAREWYEALPGESPYLKGRSLAALRREKGMAGTVTKEKIAAAQARIISKYDLSEWATRHQAAEYLGYNDTSTYALYKEAGGRFKKDHAVLLYLWEDLKAVKAALLSKKGNGSNLAEILKMRLAEEGYDFTTEKTFPDLAHIRPLRFDFCIPSRHVLIEVQGRQHFVYGFKGVATEISLEEIQRRDTLKCSFAKKNGWDLLWVSTLSDVSDALAYLNAPSVPVSNLNEMLVDDYGAAALDHYDGDAPRFCWLHRGHFPYHRAGMKLKRIHKSYWDSAVGKGKSPHAAWETGKREFIRLVKNRQKYNPALNKRPGLGGLPTLGMLVAGFGISKICPPASFFMPRFGAALLKMYGSGDTVVDPFSGFSGRLIAAYLSGYAYVGADISSARVTEAQDVIREFAIPNASVSVEDIRNAPERSYANATLLTCPPYGNKESWDGVVGFADADYWISLALRKNACSRYIFIIGRTRMYSTYEVPFPISAAHNFYTCGERHVLVIDRASRDKLVAGAPYPV